MMRGISLVMACSLVLAAQGCTLTIPAGLTGGLAVAGATAPKGASPAPKPATTPCDADFNKHDLDHSGSWSRPEYEAYFATLPRTEIACMAPQDPGSSEPPRTITCPQHDPKIQFDRLDANHDGQIDRGEQCARADRPVSDPDGTVSSPIFPGRPGGAPGFQPGIPDVPRGEDPPGNSEPGWSGPDDPGMPGYPGRPPIDGPPAGPYPWSSCQETMTRADANRDGRVDLKEYSAGDFRPPPPPGTARAAVMPDAEEFARLFASMDHDGDGLLDGTEMCGIPAAYLPKPKPTPTPKPTPSPTPAVGCLADFVNWDLNQDGGLDYREFAEGKFARIRFFKAPTEAEVASMKAGFQEEAARLDTNQDKQLSKDEFAAACAAETI